MVVTVVTDHQPLKWIHTVKNPAPRLARWIIRLEMFDFDIEYRPGSKNGNADGLSRWPIDKYTETSMEEEEYIINNLMTKKDTLNELEIILEEEEWSDIEEESTTINVLLFKEIDGKCEQAADENIEWAKKLVKGEIDYKKVNKSTLNDEQGAYMKEKDNLKIDNDTLWRVSNEKENKVIQYVVPKTERTKLIESQHTSTTSGY